MTVKEFIKELQKYDLNREIVIEKTEYVTVRTWYVNPAIKYDGRLIIY